MAVLEASFRTVTLAMSAGFKALNTSYVMGLPSSINRGVTPAEIELIPRMRIDADAVGSPEDDSTDNPAICPCKASVKFAVGIFWILSALIVATDPVTEPSFFAEP